MAGFVILAIFMQRDQTGRNLMGPEQARSSPSVRAQGKFIGDDSCRDCHQDISRTYAETGMGRSLYRPQDRPVVEDYQTRNSVYDPRSDYHYEMIREGSEFFQREYRLDKTGQRIHELTRKVDWVIGSGRQTRTYMTEIAGQLFELPVTWYSDAARWNLSPTYEKWNQRFSRPIIPECLNCHNSISPSTEHSINRFTAIPHGIGCERCHGPGEKHVAFRRAERAAGNPVAYDDGVITNPTMLDFPEQMDVCLQCHLVGTKAVFHAGVDATTFLPGMRLTDWKTPFYTTNGAPDAGFDIASHGGRTMLSACYRESEGVLTCVYCHDPHVSVDQTDRRESIGACLSCHATETLSTAADDADHRPAADCIGCHMPQGGTGDVLHVNFTDHWIRPRVAIGTPQHSGSAGPIELRPYFPTGDPANSIRLGMGYLRYYEETEQSQVTLQRAMDHIREGLAGSPEHSGGLFSLAKALYLSDRPDEGLTYLTKALRLRPDYFDAHYLMGLIHDALGETASARRAYLNGLSVYDQDSPLLNNLANVELQEGHTADAEAYYRLAMEADPTYMPTYANLGLLYFLNWQQADMAEEIWRQGLALDPDHTVTLNHMGTYHLLIGETDLATDNFKRVLEIDSGFIPAHGNLAAIYRDRGETALAQQHLMRILALEPKNVTARRLLQEIGNPDL